MARAGDVEDAQIVRLDDAVQVNVDEVQPGRRAPVAEQPWLDVRAASAAGAAGGCPAGRSARPTGSSRRASRRRSCGAPRHPADRAPGGKPWDTRRADARFVGVRRVMTSLAATTRSSCASELDHLAIGRHLGRDPEPILDGVAKGRAGAIFAVSQNQPRT